MLMKQPYKKAEHLAPMFNVGAGMDIITGTWETGIHGESILNGGLSQLSGYTGMGNMYKTAVMLYKLLMAMSRIHAQSTCSVYETEMNTQGNRINMLSRNMPEFHGEDLIMTERMVMTNRAIYEGGEWYDTTKDWLSDKCDLAAKNKEMKAKLPFLKKGTMELMEMVIPTFGGLDSFTDFVTKDAAKMSDDTTLGDSGAETMFMKQGISKLRLLSEYPPLLHRAAHYFGMTAQVGPIFSMDKYNPEKKKLSNIVGNVKMKGVTDKFSYIMNSILQFHNLEKMLTKDKMPRFPRDEFDNAEGDTDLNLLHAVELRGKGGPSGVPIQLVVSQQNGVLGSMTEFFNLLTHPDRFGLSGNDQNYTVTLCPDHKLSRTKVRTKIDEHVSLQRALNISMELMQMTRMMPHLRNEGLLCTADELFQGVKEKGYDWDQILGNTRGWYCLNNDDHVTPFLSTMDLMKMRKGTYKPYWM